MEMKHFRAFFLLSLLLFVCVADARKDPRDYWKSRMNGEPMPKAIEDLFHQNPMNSDSFVRNFETKPNVIIYHNPHDDHPEELKASAELMHVKSRQKGSRN